MNQSTLDQLLALNSHFYQITAESFSRSREYFWSGWDRLVEHLNSINSPNSSINILDLGCGNGRFGLFLSIHLKSPFLYYGVDENAQLLSIARDKLNKAEISFELYQFNLLKKLQNNQKWHFNWLKSPDLITVFGVIHHLPSLSLRKKFFEELYEQAQPNGLIIISLWQFANDPHFKNKIINPAMVNINERELENNDFILDWQRGTQAYRYCHHVDDQEIIQLLNNHFEIKDDFLADGKFGVLNRYLVLQAKTVV